MTENLEIETLLKGRILEKLEPPKEPIIPTLETLELTEKRDVKGLDFSHHPNLKRFYDDVNKILPFSGRYAILNALAIESYFNKGIKTINPVHVGMSGIGKAFVESIECKGNWYEKIDRITPASFLEYGLERKRMGLNGIWVIIDGTTAFGTLSKTVTGNSLNILNVIIDCPSDITVLSKVLEGVKLKKNVKAFIKGLQGQGIRASLIMAITKEKLKWLFGHFPDVTAWDRVLYQNITYTPEEENIQRRFIEERDAIHNTVIYAPAMMDSVKYTVDDRLLKSELVDLVYLSKNPFKWHKIKVDGKTEYTNPYALWSIKRNEEVVKGLVCSIAGAEGKNETDINDFIFLEGLAEQFGYDDYIPYKNLIKILKANGSETFTNLHRLSGLSSEDKFSKILRLMLERGLIKKNAFGLYELNVI